MSNTIKPKNDYTEATWLNKDFTNASLQIKNARENINTAKKIIAAEEEVILKAELIMNIVNWKTTILDIAPIMPKSWENNPKLKSRYENLIQFIENNPIWWTKYWDKIELQDEWIDFKKLHFILDLDDLPETKNWYDLENKKMLGSIPNLRDFRVISSFINSAWSENRLFLKDFLGLNADLYWSSTEFSWDKTRAFKMGFGHYANDDVLDSKGNPSNIKTGERY